MSLLPPPWGGPGLAARLITLGALGLPGLFSAAAAAGPGPGPAAASLSAHYFTPF